MRLIDDSRCDLLRYVLDAIRMSGRSVFRAEDRFAHIASNASAPLGVRYKIDALFPSHLGVLSCFFDHIDRHV
jgi:hypothetical protein